MPAERVRSAKRAACVASYTRTRAEQFEMSPKGNSMHALDLPRLRDEPSYEELNTVLCALEIQPSTWNSQTTALFDDPGGSRFLTSILKCQFEWLDDPDDQKKQNLWDVASKRISERCGRTAMGEISRIWSLPAEGDYPSLNIEIREPPLTGDNLGFKTWGTAWAIAQQLDALGKQHFYHLLKGNQSTSRITSRKILELSKPRVLELGAGTGLLGLATAAVWSVDVTMTDLPLFQENLYYNIAKNELMLRQRGVDVSCDTLDWTDPENGLQHTFDKAFEIVIASDPLYDESHPELVAAMIKRYLRRHPLSRAMVAVPLRDQKTKDFTASLNLTMVRSGFDLLHGNTVICRDDWATSSDEEVRSWYGIWGFSNV